MRLSWNDRSVVLDAAPIGDALVALGLRPGHSLAVLAGNTPLAILMHLAAREHGWTLVPLSPLDPRPALPAQAAGCHAIVSTAALEPIAQSLRDGRPLLVCEAEGRPLRSMAAPLQAPPTGEPAAYIVQTSGTTGTARSVAITQPMLAAHATAATERLGDSGAAVWAAVLPLDRVGGIAMVERVHQNGGRMLLEERFDAPRLAQLLEHRGVTHVSLVPTMLRRLLAHWGPRGPPPTLRCVLLGGDAAPEPLVQGALAAGWPLWCTYGLTEACSQVATATPAERRLRPGTSGRPLGGVDVEVMDGEIVVSGPTVVGGRVATGDLGQMDEDGFLFVLGRKDDRITSGGVKVDPHAVEEVLRLHPDVADACVVGVPDAEWGQRVVAAMVWKSDPAADLAAWCNGKLAPAAVPKSFLPWPDLPRTASGKLRRAEVRAAIQATVPT